MWRCHTVWVLSCRMCSGASCARQLKPHTCGVFNCLPPATVLIDNLVANSWPQDIGRLFIAGFGSSMVFGTIVGSLADKQ